MACNSTETNSECCSPDEPCGVGEGDCDENSDCVGNLICGKDNCQIDFDGNWQNAEYDCCKEDKCNADHALWYCCSSETPCRVGEGDCNDDTDCIGDLICGTDNCRILFDTAWPSEHWDCCETTKETTTTRVMRCNSTESNSECCTPDETCGVGEGDCDDNSDCVGNLICGNDNCQIDFDRNWHNAEWDCCKEDKCNADDDDNECCSTENPCRVGEGDCDINAECFGDLVCGTNNCQWFDLSWKVTRDCCEASDATATTSATTETGTKSPIVMRCNSMTAHSECCTPDELCGVGEGDCDDNSDCVGNLICGEDNCQIDFDRNWHNADWDCCKEDKCNADDDDNECCSTESPCRVGEGDCDTNAECVGDLVCGTNNCQMFDASWKDTRDCCEANKAIITTTTTTTTITMTTTTTTTTTTINTPKSNTQPQ